MKLHELQNITFKKKHRKRVGCGEGSGRGKTSTRGQKGQKARAGGSIRHGFESGHIPLYRKLPHRGFNNKRFRTVFAIVNIRDFGKIEGTEVNREALLAAGMIDKRDKLIKVLGDGELAAAYTVTADKVSAGAREKIEAAGGKVVETVAEVAPADAEAPAVDVES